MSRFLLVASLVIGLGIGTISHAREGTLWDLADSPARATRVLDELAQFVGFAAQELKADQATSSWVQDRLREMFALNLYRVYASMQGPDGDPRWVGASVEPTSEGLRVHRALSPTRPQGRPMGMSTIELGMAPQRQEQGVGLAYTVEERFGLALASISAGDLLTLVAQVVTALEAQDGEAIFHRTVPNATALVKTFADIQLDRRIDEDQVRYFTVRASLDPSTLRRRGLPALARVVERWEGIGHFQAHVKDEHGHQLVGVDVRTDPATVRLEWASMKGKIVPTDGVGDAFLEEVWSFEDEAMTGFIQAQLDAGYEGFHLQASDWKMPATWTVREGTWKFGILVNEAPAIRLRGEGAFRQVLVDLADSAMGLTAHGMEFADGVARGVHGQGTRFAMEIQPAPPLGWWLEQTFESRFVDNAIVRFAFRLIGGRLVPTEEAFEEAGTLVSRMMQAGVKDYEAVRRGMVTP